MCTHSFSPTNTLGYPNQHHSQHLPPHPTLLNITYNISHPTQHYPTPPHPTLTPPNTTHNTSHPTQHHPTHPTPTPPNTSHPTPPHLQWLRLRIHVESAHFTAHPCRRMRLFRQDPHLLPQHLRREVPHEKLQEPQGRPPGGG